jgi:hypothetical protein
MFFKKTNSYELIFQDFPRSLPCLVGDKEMGEIIICFHECYFFHKDCSMKKGFEDRLQQKLSKKKIFQTDIGSNQAKKDLSYI